MPNQPTNDPNYYGTHVPKNPEYLKSYSALFALTPYVGKATISKIENSDVTQKMATMSANNLWSSNKNILETIRAVMNATVANNIAPVEPKQGEMTPNKADVGFVDFTQGIFEYSVGDGSYVAPLPIKQILPIENDPTKIGSDDEVALRKWKKERIEDMDKRLNPRIKEVAGVSKTGEVILRDSPDIAPRPGIEPPSVVGEIIDALKSLKPKKEEENK